MSPVNQIEQLAVLLEGTSIGLLELITPEGVFRLRRDGAGAIEPVDAQAVEFRAPSVGIFRIAHPALEAALAEPGRSIVAGDVVGIVQVGTLFLHVLAPADGVLQDILAADGDIVGYGTALMNMVKAKA